MLVGLSKPRFREYALMCFWSNTFGPSGVTASLTKRTVRGLSQAKSAADATLP